MDWPTLNDLENFVRDRMISEFYSLGLESEWIGDPSTSTFGIKINLTWHGTPLGPPTVIDFIGKTD